MAGAGRNGNGDWKLQKPSCRLGPAVDMTRPVAGVIRKVPGTDIAILLRVWQTSFGLRAAKRETFSAQQQPPA